MTDVVSEESPLIEGTTAVYKKRFFILFILAIQLTFCSILQITLSPVTNIVAEYYRESPVAIEWLSNVGLLAELSSIPVAYLIGKWGVRKMLIIAVFFNFFAMLLQYPAYHRDLFGLVMASRIPVSIAFNIILILPVKVSAMWYPPHERAKATGVAMVSSTIGNSIGSAQASFMIKEGNAPTIEDGLKNFFMSQVIIAGLLIPLIFFFKEKPPKPPSLSQSGEKKPVDFRGNLKTLLKDKNYWIMIHSMTLFNCIHYATGVLMNPLITSKFRKGYVKYIGVIAIVSDVSASVCMIIVAILLDKYKRYKLIAIAVNFTPAVFMLCLIIVLTNTKSFPAVFALFVAAGTFLYAYNVVFAEFSVETFYPIPEEVVAMPMMVLSSVYMVILNTGLGAAIAKGHVKLAGYFLVGVYFF